MKSFPNMITQNNFFRHKLLKNIFFASLLVAIAFPVYTLYFVFPSFNRLLIKIYSDHSVRSANHLASMFLSGTGDITRESISTRIWVESPKIIKDFDLAKYKIFSPTGEIVFSTALEEIGTINRYDYFQNIVAKGVVYSQMVNRDQRSLEGQTLPADVVETYVPVMRDNRFRGAFEIYFDITANKKLADHLLSHSSAVIVLLALGLWCTIVAILIKENRSILSQQRAEEALRESENRYRRILENIEDGYYETDRDGRITFFNESFCKILGRSCDELNGKHLRDFTDQQDAEKGYRTFKKVFTTGVAVFDLEWKIILKDGAWRPVSSSVSLIRNTPEQVIGFRGIIRDITDRKRAEDEKLRFEKLQGVLETAGGICHELNQPIQAISGFTEILMMDLSMDHPYYDKIRLISEQINRMGNITRQLMTITRYETKNYADGEKIIDIEKSSST
jgi:PAS domain S-box-containing protein